MSPRRRRGGNAPMGSKVTKERVALVVLGALLAAALIVIYRVSFENFWTKQRLQTLIEEPEAKKRNCSDKPTPACDEGWELYGDKCYHFSAFRGFWDISRSFCREYRADLVKIDSEEEQRFLLDKLKDIMTYPEDKFWIGLTDSESEGTWLWVDGSPLEDRLQFWWYNDNFTEPDNWTGADPHGEDCVRMGEIEPGTDLNQWLDATCKMHQRSICAKPAKGRE